MLDSSLFRTVFLVTAQRLYLSLWDIVWLATVSIEHSPSFFFKFLLPFFSDVQLLDSHSIFLLFLFIVISTTETAKKRFLRERPHIERRATGSCFGKEQRRERRVEIEGGERERDFRKYSEEGGKGMREKTNMFHIIIVLPCNIYLLRKLVERVQCFKHYFIIFNAALVRLP